jgi:hypothetical protein
MINRGLHDNFRKTKNRQINIENLRLAKQLVSIQGSSELKKDYLEDEYNKQLKVKANLCKLPIINMKLNIFSEKDIQGKKKRIKMSLN